MPETASNGLRDDLLIAPADIRRLLEQGGAVTVTVLDTRGSAAFSQSAERVEDDLRVLGSKGVPEILDRLSRHAWILAYCTCLNDGLAVRVAERLREQGFPKAFAVEGGLAGCAEAGLHVVSKVAC